jgi:hypothetical protein
VRAATAVQGLDPGDGGGADVVDGAPRLPVELSIFIFPIRLSHVASVERLADGAQAPDQASAARPG